MRTLLLLFALVSGSVLIGCSDSTPTQPTEAVSEAPEEKQESSPQLTTLNTVTEHTFRQTTELLHLGHQLHIAVTRFLDTPTETTLQQAQQAYLPILKQWVAAMPYVHMTALTSSGAPIINRLEKLPMLPGYLDQLPDYPFSGLVHDIMLPIQANNLTLLHTLDQDEQVIFGLSAIEFLLFDHYQADHFKKFVPMTSLSAEEQKENIKLEQLPNNRRRALLLLQANVLVEDLSNLHKRWRPTGDDAQRFSALTDKNLKLTLTKSYQRITELVLDALNSIQEKPLMLGRAHFAREERMLLSEGITSLESFHKALRPIWELYPQSEKTEFDGVLDSLLELYAQYQQDPSNSLLLELASNRCNQLIEIADDLTFSPPDN
jgi:putative iron-regulated protein